MGRAPSCATLTTAGSQTLTATDATTSSITGTSGPITVGAAAASHFVVSAQPVVLFNNSFPFTVVAEDAFNNLALTYGGTVHFTASDTASGVVVPPDSTLTNGTGTFNATLQSFGTTATLTATDTVNAAITGSSNPIQIVAGAASSFVVSAPDSTTAGSSFQFTVVALNSNNQTATNYTGTVVFSSSDTSASFVPLQATLVSGTGTFTATLKQAGSQTLIASDTIAPSIQGTTTVTVNPGEAQSLAVSFPSPVAAGSFVIFTVTALDPYGNTATDYNGSIQFSSSDSQASLPSSAGIVGGNGLYVASLQTAGIQSVTATSGTLSGTDSSITVVAGSVTHFAVATPNTATAGTPITVTVTAEDAFNNAVSGYSGTVNLTSSDSRAQFNPQSGVLPNSGSGTFSVTLFTVGTQSISATDSQNSSLTGKTSVTVSTAAVSHFVVAAPSATTAGNAFLFTVTAEDPFNNVVTGYHGTVLFSTSDTQAAATGGLQSSGMLTNGSGVFIAVLKTAGNQTLTATDSANSSVTGASGAIAVSATTTSHLAVIAPATATAGTTTRFTVVAEDRFNNTAPTYSGTVLFTVSDHGALTTLPANSTLTAGVGVFSAYVNDGRQSDADSPRQDDEQHHRNQWPDHG